MLINDYDHLQLTDASLQVVVYISGYISLKLSEHTHCPVCLSSLNNNIISSEYVSNLNQGGLTLPCTLQHYVLSVFCLLEVSEKRNLKFQISLEISSTNTTSIATVEWDSSFACVDHSEKSKESVNKSVSNIYFKDTALEKNI